MNRRYLRPINMNPDKLFDYLDGRLSREEREKLEEQLIRDPELQREFGMARRIHQGMTGDVREVITDRPRPEGARGSQIVRRITIVFLVLIFINTVAGLIAITLIEKQRHRAQTESEQNRREVASAVQKAAANAFPTPSLDINEIKITALARELNAMVDKISAAAKQAGGSATKNLTNENGTLVFAEIPVDHLTQFRDALAKLGAALPPPVNPGPTSGNAILQIRIVQRAE